jgi:hypothetical protein
MHRLLPVLAAMASSYAAAIACGTDFYVSPQGDDRNPGTLDRPLKSLERARDVIRALRGANEGKVPSGGVTVWLRGGRYELSQPFILGPEDSGQPGRPVGYRSYADERPVLSGGRLIRGWKKVEGTPPGLPEAARGKVWAASVPEAKDCRWPFRQLWADGQRLTRARWPNHGEIRFLVVDAAMPPADAVKNDPVALERWRQELKRAWRTVQFRPEDLRTFPGNSLPGGLGDGPAELFSTNGGQWATMRIPVEKAAGTQLTTAAPLGCLSYYWGAMRLMTGGSGHVENALSLLDQAGEWYLDRKAGVVCYLPPDGEDPNAREFVAPRLELLVCLRGTAQAPVAFVELRGLRLEHAEWPLPAFGYRPTLGCCYGTQLTPLVAAVPCAAGSVRPKDEYPEWCLPAAVDLTYARQCRLELCRVGRVGASGIGLGEGCRGNRVVGCEVFDAGGIGIHAGLAHGPICGEDFAWNRAEDEPQDSEIANCYVHHTGRMDWGAYGILSSYCRRTRIAHNLVEQQPYSGICACFTWFAFPSGRDEEVTVEYNHIHHVLERLFDGGGIYTKDGVAKSSLIRGNLIHDIGGDSPANNGIFLDDGSYGFHLEGNMVYGMKMPVRFNNTSRERFTWGTNFFTAASFPRELADKAGPEEPYRSLLLRKP